MANIGLQYNFNKTDFPDWYDQASSLDALLFGHKFWPFVGWSCCFDIFCDIVSELMQCYLDSRTQLLRKQTLYKNGQILGV